jgi:hypothetical protein
MSLMFCPVAMAPNWTASRASSRSTTRPLWASSHITEMLVGGVGNDFSLMAIAVSPHTHGTP